MKKYDIIIIGAGIAGLTAAIYGVRAGKKVCVIEKNIAGGQIMSASEVANYPGFNSIAGYQLIGNIERQALELGVELIYDNAISFDFKANRKIVKTINDEFEANAIILALGTRSKTLGLKNENELTGNGVSYCATCDGAFFKNKIVAVAGDGNPAIKDVNYLSQIANKVYLINRREINEKFDSNVEKFTGAEIIELIGNPLQAVKLRLNDGKEKILDCSGLFVAAGYSPSTQIVEGLVDLDEKGYIIVDETMRTSENNVFAAGDAVRKTLRQLITAASDGAIAGHNAAKVK